MLKLILAAYKRMAQWEKAKWEYYPDCNIQKGFLKDVKTKYDIKDQ